MATSVADLFALLDGIPAGAWVAISVEQHKVLAYGADSEALLQKAREKGEEHPLMMRVPELNIAMAL
jgi:hypothetical protein